MSKAGRGLSDDGVRQGRSLISDEERAERLRAIETARASIFLEGFSVGPEIDALDQRFIDGELSMDELIAATKRALGLPE